MTIRVYELASELGVDSKTLIGICDSLGIDVTSHMQGLSEDQAGLVRTARGGGTEATVTRFDKSTGKGQVRVSLRDEERELPFDLRYTRLEDEKYVPIDAGDTVRVQLNEEAVVAMRSKPS